MSKIIPAKNKLIHVSANKLLQKNLKRVKLVTAHNEPVLKIFGIRYVTSTNY